MKKLVTALLVLATPIIAESSELRVKQIGFFAETEKCVEKESCTEISAFSNKAMRVYATNADSNGIRMLDVNQSGELKNAGFIDLSSYGGGPNSVAVHGDLVAVAVEAKNKQANGSIVLFDLTGKPAQIQGLKGNIIEAGACQTWLPSRRMASTLLLRTRANQAKITKWIPKDPCQLSIHQIGRYAPLRLPNTIGEI